MLKLMKYEFRKQAFSKLIISVILAAMLVLYAVMLIRGNADGAGVTIGLTVSAMFIAVMFVAFECLNTYAKDLKTKQSYMLFMLPKSSRSILLSKILASAVQVITILAVFTVVVFICAVAYAARFEDIAAFINDLFDMFFNTKLSDIINIRMALRVITFTLTVWLFLVVLALFVITLANTVANNNKFMSFLSVIAYFVFIIVIDKIESATAYHLLKDIAQSNVAGGDLYLAAASVFYLIVDIAFFFVTSWLIDKRLSV